MLNPLVRWNKIGENKKVIWIRGEKENGKNAFIIKKKYKNTWKYGTSQIRKYLRIVEKKSLKRVIKLNA